MEKQYKVMVIAHQLKNNVIAKGGDVVSESQLDGNASDLVNQGFVNEIVVVEEKEVKTENAKAVKPNADKK